MNTENQILLTAQDAVQAICEDFQQYDPQILLFSEIITVISNGRMVVQREAGKEGLWLHLPGESRMRWRAADELIAFMCELVSQVLPDIKKLAAICSRVFRNTAHLQQNPDTNRLGILLSTGMQDFICKQCGHCCNTLIYHDSLSAEDVKAWQDTGRKDILKWVGVFPKNGQESIYRVWMKPGTREFVQGCPFLYKNPHANKWLCRIHQVKPKFCRQYPLSRKHALMTGCPGFRKSPLR